MKPREAVMVAGFLKGIIHARDEGPHRPPLLLMAAMAPMGRSPFPWIRELEARNVPLAFECEPGNLRPVRVGMSSNTTVELASLQPS